jgi:hypothetical protein
MKESSRKVVEFNDSNLSRESENYLTYSKFVYDYFITQLTDYTFTNYAFEAYKSWGFKYPNLELFWDGRDEYLLLWDISGTNKKTLKIIETSKLTVDHIHEFINLVNTKKQE